MPDAVYDSRNEGRVVSLSVLGLLSACVRFRQLREVHQSLQQALNSWSQTQSAATDGSPACCTSSLMLSVCVVLRVLPSQSSVRSLLVLLLYRQRCLSCLTRLLLRSASVTKDSALAEAVNLSQLAESDARLEEAQHRERHHAALIAAIVFRIWQDRTRIGPSVRQRPRRFSNITESCLLYTSPSPRDS